MIKKLIIGAAVALVTAGAVHAEPMDKVKAAFVYVGPIGDQQCQAVDHHAGCVVASHCIN